jgi:hypothetical protein
VQGDLGREKLWEKLGQTVKRWLAWKEMTDGNDVELEERNDLFLYVEER